MVGGHVGKHTPEGLARLRALNTKPGRRSDAEIVAYVEAGHSLRDAGRWAPLSPERVRQIMSAHRRANGIPDMAVPLWTLEEQTYLIEKVASGEDLELIAIALNRTLPAVKAQCRRLNVPIRPKKYKNTHNGEVVSSGLPDAR